MSPDQETEAQVMHKVDYTALQHPRYATAAAETTGPWLLNLEARIGDEVGEQVDHDGAIVVGIYLDGMVELSTGDQVAAAELVLLGRAQ